MCYFHSDKKSWKIFVILFGGIKNSPYLCSRFSGARQFESKFSLRSIVQSLHRQLRPAEQFHRGSKSGMLTTGARDKQIAASVLSYHRQGPLLREGQERTKGEERACERRTEREKRGRNRQREKIGRNRQREKREEQFPSPLKP